MNERGSATTLIRESYGLGCARTVLIWFTTIVMLNDAFLNSGKKAHTGLAHSPKGSSPAATPASQASK